MPAQPKSIDEVIDGLTTIIDTSKETDSRLGYFAALYRKVTITVKQRIDEGNYFDDNERMERLDVIFANRYLAAYEEMKSGADPTQSWKLAFRVGEQWWPIVLQHLLIGMNAHINLDLGIAAVQTVGGSGLAGLQDDFNRINTLLAGLVGDVKQELAWVWKPLRWLNNHLGSVEDVIINFSMEKARDAAWQFAEELGALPEPERATAISRRDGEVVILGRAIRHPGIFLSGVTKLVRLTERGSVKQIIDILE